MFKLEPIEEIVRVVLATGFLSDDKAISALLVAKATSGKTSILRKYSLKANSVFYTTDATAFGIIRDSNGLNDFKNKKYRHIIIPDLIACLSRKASTVNTFIGFMNALIEEGIVNISSYANKIGSIIPAERMEISTGLITSITSEMFKRKKSYWTAIGFLSRLLPISYDYTEPTRVDILDFIESQKHLQESLEKLNLPDSEKLIALPVELAKQIEPYTFAFAQAENTYGFRYQRNLQTFLKAIALLDGQTEVTQNHFDKFKELVKYINLKHTSI